MGQRFSVVLVVGLLLTGLFGWVYRSAGSGHQHTFTVFDGDHIQGVVFSAPQSGSWSWRLTVHAGTGWEHIVGTQKPNTMPWLPHFTKASGYWSVPAVTNANYQLPEREFQITFEGDLIPVGPGEQPYIGEWSIEAEAATEYMVLPQEKIRCVGTEVTFSAEDEEGNKVVSNWTVSGGPQSFSTNNSTFITFTPEQPGIYTVVGTSTGTVKSDSATLTTIKVELVLPSQPAHDNFPVEGIELSVTPESARDYINIISISNTPKDPDPQNALGTTEMTFVETGHGMWDIEKAIWYGSTANPVAYGRWTDGVLGAEYKAPHTITVEYTLSGGSPCEATGELRVVLTDGLTGIDRHLDFYCEIKRDLLFRYYIDMKDTLFSKRHVERNWGAAVSQYRNMILDEERVHINQLYGADEMALGWDPGSHNHHGDVLTHPAWEQLYIDKAEDAGGIYDPSKRRITFPLAATLGDVADAQGDARLDVINKWNWLLLERKAKEEKEAKSFVGFNEAYGYRHTYMLPPTQFPEFPEWKEWPESE